MCSKHIDCVAMVPLNCVCNMFKLHSNTLWAHCVINCVCNMFKLHSNTLWAHPETIETCKPQHHILTVNIFCSLKGQEWSIPYSLNQPREDLDKGITDFTFKSNTSSEV